MARLCSAFLSLHARLGTLPLIGLAVIAFYVLYVVKMHLGIDIFPNWGLHLLGPRSLIRYLINELNAPPPALPGSARSPHAAASPLLPILLLAAASRRPRDRGTPSAPLPRRQVFRLYQRRSAGRGGRNRWQDASSRARWRS